MRTIKSFTLAAEAGAQFLTMPRKAKIIGVSGGIKSPILHAEVEVDDGSPVSRAENKHQRRFAVLKEGDATPAGGVLVGGCNVLMEMRGKGEVHPRWVYELAAVAPSGL